MSATTRPQHVLETDDGPRANERLTAWAGAVLFVLLAVEGLTILVSVRHWLTVHVLVGVALIGPLVVKLASTGYRFVRYYTGSPAYVRSGPPRTWLRILAPLLVLATLAVLVSGIALLLLPDGPRGLLMLAHQASFVGWLGLAGLHVLAYVWRVPGLILADLSRRPGRRQGRFGAAARAAAVVLSLVAGSALAWLTLPSVHAWH